MRRPAASAALLPALAALFAAVAGTLVSPATAAAAEVPIPPAPTRWVTDTAGVLSAATRDALDAQLQQYQQTTGHQVIVWIGQTTGDSPLEDWTIRAFTKWKVGRKGLDDGLALFIFMSDHKIRIEVGYGLEGQVTDATASQIARSVIAPRLRAGDVDGAVTEGVKALLAAIGGQTGFAPAEQPASQVSVWAILPPLIFVIIIFIIIIRSARYAASRGYTVGSAGYGPMWWGGFGGGSSGGSSDGGFGGGFSGGGGMGGGGGASASW